MSRERICRRLLLAVLACALVATATASAQPAKVVQPLNQYLVSGVDPKLLADLGFDRTEATTPKAKGKYLIVATPSQVAALRGKGAKVQALKGVTRATVRARRAGAKARRAGTSPLQNPTHGYDVFRPWSLKPAACPGTCATPNIPLKDWYHQFARSNRDVVKEEVIGHSRLGQSIIAYKVTAKPGAKDGKLPTVLYDSTQHAREWIATEVERRLFQYIVSHKGDAQVAKLLKTREMWFVPVVNPDGYDYTFVSPATRLWRKNLNDNDGDGQITNLDGVDTNRNFNAKWNYDLEGASDDLADETYHGPSAGSEPEVKAMRALEKRLDPAFQLDYHSFAQLILYPEGWQVQTPATDAPLTQALAGNSDHPAVPGFDPEVSAQLYTTNGDITDDAYFNYGVEAYTVELDGGTGAAVGGTDGSDPNFTPGGFVFQDKDADVQAEFQKNLAFALDLAKSTTQPDNPVSHLGNTAPDLVPTTFPTSYGTPQTVEVNAKRSLGKVSLHWTVNGGREHTASTSEWKGGERYGEPGVYYHRLRAQIGGTDPGDKVKVWFEARKAKTKPFSYDVKSDSGNPVLLMVAEDYTGRSSVSSPTPYGSAPLYTGDYAAALNANGAKFDTYDVDAAGRTAPTQLGVLSHYKAVIWETGDDVIVRGPDQVLPGGAASGGGTGTESLFNDEVISARDYLNEGGKLLVAGQFALEGAWEQQLYNPLGATPPNPFCPASTTSGTWQGDRPDGQATPCNLVADDFMQYWLGAYSPNDAGDPAAAAMTELTPFGTQSLTLNGADSKQNKQNLYRFLTTSDVLPVSTYPQFTSNAAVKTSGAAPYDPPDGSFFMFSQRANAAYKRLTTTVDLTGATSGALQFKESQDTEPGYDFVFVEAHTVGQDDWTTLPDANGNTSNDTGLGCPDPDPFWLNQHPFLKHYMTRTADASSDTGFTCTPTGTSGAWNAATGNSSGFHDWNVDLTPFAGKKVEVSITYQTDPATQGLGVFVDDAKTVVGGATTSSTSFETDDISPWTVGGPPEGSGPNANNWVRSPSPGFEDGPGIRTPRSVLLGFGVESVTGQAQRNQLVKDGLSYLGVSSP
jgi:hypothetical protein